jgi:hypothetical protein
MKSFKMEVSKKENGAYVKQGEVEVYYPLLSDMGISINPEKIDEDGFPVYSDAKVQYVFDGLLAAVKAQARNRLVSGTATLKAGLSIATSVEELLESGGRTGEALQTAREFLADLKAWLPSTGKSATVQAMVLTFAKSAEVLALQDAGKKEKMGKYLADWASTLSADKAEKYSKKLLALQEAIETDTEEF